MLVEAVCFTAPHYVRTAVGGRALNTFRCKFIVLCSHFFADQSVRSRPVPQKVSRRRSVRVRRDFGAVLAE